MLVAMTGWMPESILKLLSAVSSPGLTGRSSIPETIVLEPMGRGVLGRPVKPGDDTLVRTQFCILAT